MNLMLETKSPQIINVIYLRHQLLKKICNIRLDLVNKYTVFQVQVNADSKQKFLTLSYFYYWTVNYCFVFRKLLGNKWTHQWFNFIRLPYRHRGWRLSLPQARGDIMPPLRRLSTSPRPQPHWRTLFFGLNSHAERRWSLQRASYKLLAFFVASLHEPCSVQLLTRFSWTGSATHVLLFFLVPYIHRHREALFSRV